MFGMFKKKARKAVVEVKKMENRDAVEATVWGHTQLLTPMVRATQKKLLCWRRPSRPCRRSRLLLVKLPR